MGSGAPSIIWDFDHSMIDVNSDTFVPEELEAGRTSKIRAYSSGGMPWTTVMATTMVELHAGGATAAEVTAAAGRVPMSPAVERAIRHAHAHGASQHVLSDANSVFISAALEARGLTALFSSVVTNPAAFDSGGCLRISPHHTAPHGCPLCPPNLCKGAALGAMGLPPAAPARCVYVGDGRGDVCPSLRLRAGDAVLARAGYPLLDELRARAARGGLRAAVHEWRSGEDLELLLQHAVTTGL